MASPTQWTYKYIYICSCLVDKSCLTLCLFVTPWMQVPLSVGCPKKELPSPGALSDPGSEPRSPVAGWFFTAEPPGKLIYIYIYVYTHTHTYTYSHAFLYSILIEVITEYLVEFSVLYSSFVSVIYFVYIRLYMSYPVSQFIPLCLTPLVTIIFTAEVICYFFPVVSNAAKD